MGEFREAVLDPGGVQPGDVEVEELVALAPRRIFARPPDFIQVLFWNLHAV
jgi:hypothetical protein